MGPPPGTNNQELQALRQASQGTCGPCRTSWGAAVAGSGRMVKLRLDPRVQGRVDPLDVIQEAYLEVSRNLAAYLRDPKLPFFLWLRLLTAQKLALARAANPEPAAGEHHGGILPMYRSTRVGQRRRG